MITIIINHLTRMRRGFICVAGIALGTNQHVRPVLQSGNLTTNVLSLYGGPFDIGNIVYLGHMTHQPAAPHVEDHLFVPSRASVKGVSQPAGFWEILKKVSKVKLKDIFGQELKRLGRSVYGTDVGSGKVSLGCLQLHERPSLNVETRGPGRSQIRLLFTDGELRVNAGITDIRLYELEDFSFRNELIAELNAQIRGNDDIILSVGLSRPFASSPEFEPVNWLQVNNIHFSRNPVWQLRKT